MLYFKAINQINGLHYNLRPFRLLFHLNKFVVVHIDGREEEHMDSSKTSFVGIDEDKIIYNAFFQFLERMKEMAEAYLKNQHI